MAKHIKKRKKNNISTALNDTQKCINYLKSHYRFRYNTVKKTTEYCPNGEKMFRYLEDDDFRSIRINIEKDNKVNFKCSRELLKDIIFSNSTWKKFDPFKNWIDKLPKWDGKDHIAMLASTIHSTDDKYFCWTLRKWLVGFVACLYYDDETNQTCFFLCGKQGDGKSTWLRNLLPEEVNDYYYEGSIDFSDKDSKIRLGEVALINLDEGNSLKSKDIDNLKELITMKKIKLRRAYAHMPSVFIRRCSFCGSANNEKILNDMTGNRRFLCHSVISIKYQHNVDMKQVFAQAMHIFRTKKFNGKDFYYWFDDKEQTIVEKYNKKFRNQSLEEMLIEEMYEKCILGAKGYKLLTATEITNNLMQRNPGQRLSPQKVGTTLSMMKFKDHIAHGGIHKWVVKEK